MDHRTRAERSGCGGVVLLVLRIAAPRPVHGTHPYRLGAIGPTDKNYKAYLESPVTDAEATAIRERWMTSDTVACAIRDLGERDGKTPGQVQADLDAEWERQAPGRLHGKQSAKFYYQHLSPGQRDEFIALHNDGALHIGYPGHLYVRPFFASTAEEAMP